jgi:hypothetical protein
MRCPCAMTVLIWDGPRLAAPAGAAASIPVRTCRWIDGDVREPGWRYCGQPTIAGRSWCVEHNARAYRRGGATDGEG